MKPVRLSGIAGFLIAIAVVALAGSAIAYFSAGGAGNAAAAVSKLTVPTFTAATPAVGGKVTLTWGAVVPPGEGTVTYFVTRDGGNPAGNCPVEATPTTVKTCVDETVPVGEHNYEVTVVWRSWKATSVVKTANVTIGAVASFSITATATSIVAGGTSNLSITARDEKGSVVTSYTGSHTLVFSGAAAAPNATKPTVSNSSGTATNFGSNTAISFTSGVSTVNTTTRNGVLRLYQAGTANIVATEGTITTPSPLAITVSPATPFKFAFSAATTTPTAGAVDELTTTAQDTYGNTATSYTGSHDLVFSSAAASPDGNTPTVSDASGADVPFGSATALDFSAGVARASEGDGGRMKLYKSGSTSIAATEGSLTTPTVLTVTVAPGTAARLVLSTPTAPVAGTGFNVTTTARDAYGNTATGYTGSKNITFAGASASPSGALPTVVNAAGTAVNFGTATALTFTAGVATPASSKNGFMKLNKAEAVSITAGDGTISTPAALALTVATGAAARVGLIELTASPGSVGSPCLFTCPITSLTNAGTVKAKAAITDSVGNVVSNLAAKTVTVTATSGSTVTGSPLTTAASGPAISATEFTYKPPASGSFTHTITAASTGYTSATATVSK